MNTVVYPLKSQSDYTELKYSLRSIDRFLKKPFEVLVLGEKMPDWINNVTHINVPDVSSKKQLTIKIKILAALEYAEEILFMNDDLYLLKSTDGVPYYWHGDLKNVGENGSKTLQEQLKKLGRSTKNFDGHYPLIYDQRFKVVAENFSGDTIIKSAYCNYLGIDGIYAPDCKIITETKPEAIRNFIKNKPCFSTGAHSLSSAKQILQELFPNKSNFEL